MSNQTTKQEGVMPPEIQIDEGLQLRFLKPEDATEIYAMLEEAPDIQRYVGLFQECHSEQEVFDKIEDQMTHGALRYGILKEGGLIGYIGIWPDPDVKEVVQYNISYFLARKHRGAGVVTKALQQLLIEAEKHLKIDRFSAWAEEGNEASAAILLNLGFVTTNIPHKNSHGQTAWDYVKEVKRA